MAEAPLADAVDRFLADPGLPFTVPGHKRSPQFGDSLLALDLPLYGGADDLQLSGGHLQRAEQLAADLWGADYARFSVNGSSHGNHALLWGLARPGDRVAVSRNLHKSLLVAMILGGVEPLWIFPEVDPATGLALGYPEAAVDDALAQDVAAVFLVNPTYVGVMTPLGPIVEAAHQRGLPVAVDQAWGGHLGLDPRFPAHALGEGADALVLSVHKTLTGFTQSALVLARDDRIDLETLDAAFELGHTTSPSAAILASIDRARALVEERGAELSGRALEMAGWAREQLSAIPGVTVFTATGRYLHDPLKLVISVAGTGADGFAVDDELLAGGVRLEMADRDTLVPILTFADDRDAVERLVAAVTAAIERHRGPRPRPVGSSAVWRLRTEAVLPPREAHFARHQRVPATQAIGRVSAETVAPYPPGIPAICPGELITAELVEALRAEAAAGTRMAYCGDATLETLAVVTG